MSYFTPFHVMVILAAFFIPMLAQAEPVTLRYFTRVELVMLGPENASFACAHNDSPAQIEFNEDTRGSFYVNFPTSFLDRPDEPPVVDVRRGNKLVRQRTAETLPKTIGNDDWNMSASGNIDICVGPATLQVMQGSLNAYANLGKFEGNILDSENLLQDLRIEYEVNASGRDLLHFFHSTTDDFKSPMYLKFTGSMPVAEGRILGRLDFNATQLAVTFSGPSDIGEFTHPTRLNVRLILLEAGTASE